MVLEAKIDAMLNYKDQMQILLRVNNGMRHIIIYDFINNKVLDDYSFDEIKLSEIKKLEAYETIKEFYNKIKYNR